MLFVFQILKIENKLFSCFTEFFIQCKNIWRLTSASVLMNKMDSLISLHCFVFFYAGFSTV